YKMVLMAKSLPSLHPNQLSFRDASSYIILKLTQLSSQTPGNVPRDVLDIVRNARQFKLDGKRDRAYPRALKMSKNNYPIKPKKNAVHTK
ncbi:MAG: IS4 family transposase, partial [Shewanella sp.]